MTLRPFYLRGKEEDCITVIPPDAVPCSASIKVTDEDFDEICAREGFIPAPYLARYKWIYMDDIRRLSKNEWTMFIETAYRLVAAKLSLEN